MEVCTIYSERFYPCFDTGYLLSLHASSGGRLRSLHILILLTLPVKQAIALLLFQPMSSSLILEIARYDRSNTIDKEGNFFFLVNMAKQAGFIKITGTIDNVCFYKLEGEYYARQKSSLSRKRVKTSPAFRETMRYAGLMARASVIGSKIYHLLPKEKKGREVYNRLTGKAVQLLKEGNSEETTFRLLKEKE